MVMGSSPALTASTSFLRDGVGSPLVHLSHAKQSDSAICKRWSRPRTHTTTTVGEKQSWFGCLSFNKPNVMLPVPDFQRHSVTFDFSRHGNASALTIRLQESQSTPSSRANLIDGALWGAWPRSVATGPPSQNFLGLHYRGTHPSATPGHLGT